MGLKRSSFKVFGENPVAILQLFGLFAKVNEHHRCIAGGYLSLMALAQRPDVFKVSAGLLVHAIEMRLR